jgi:hypothetical protein
MPAASDLVVGNVLSVGLVARLRPRVLLIPSQLK